MGHRRKSLKRRVHGEYIVHAGPRGGASVDRREIEQLVAEGESETLELKKSTGQLGRAGETLCSFLNGGGGRVLIGVTPSGRVIGQQVSDSTQQEVAETLRQIEPATHIEIERVPVGDVAEVIVLHAAPMPDRRPFTFKGRPFQRVGSTTSRMPQDRYAELLLAREHGRRRWENHTTHEIELSRLDADEILGTVRRARETGRLAESVGTDVEDILDRLGLRDQDGLLNAAMVLFGSRFLPDYPQCHLRLARFRGTDKSEFLDQRQLEGHTFDLLDEAMLFLRRHLPVAGRIQPGLFERVDEPLFPLAALRESLVNAFCHRDYSRAGGAVSVAVYDDRLEVWSDGNLPAGLTVEDLKRDHPSRPRNPLIANVFYLRGLVERWGRGTQKIVELCVKAGHPEPEYVEQAGAVAVRFLPSGDIAPHRVPHDLTERQRRILTILAGASRLPFRAIRDELPDPPADRTLRDDLAYLKRLGLVRKEGRARATVWLLDRAQGE